MKKSVGKKLLAGIVSASMILGIPVTGYSQEETQDIIALEEAADAAEAILAGAESVDVQIPQETAEAAAPEEVPVSEDEPTLEILDEMPLTEGDAVLEMAADEDVPEEELFVVEEAEETEIDLEDGILLEASEEDVLEAAAGQERMVNSEETFRNAIKQAAEGDVIKLTDSITVSGDVYMDNDSMHMLQETASISIDLGGYTLTTDDFYVKTGKTLSLSNGSFNGSFCVEGGTVKLALGTTVSGSECFDIDKNGTVFVYGAQIISAGGTDAYAIHIKQGTLNLESGSIKVTENNRVAIGLEDDSSVVEMKDGIIENTGNEKAVEIKKGQMTVHNGTIKSASSNGVFITGGSFTLEKGAITSQKSAVNLNKVKGTVTKVAISGTKDTTKLISKDAYAFYELDCDNNASVDIKGGYFEGKTEAVFTYTIFNFIDVNSRNNLGFGNKVDRIYLSDPINCRTADEDGDNVYTIYNLDASNAAAAYIRDGNTFYTESLGEAMKKVSTETYSPKSGDTVILFKDITEKTTNEETVTVGMDRIIDLNGHILKTKMTVTDCDVTVKNGTLQSYTNDFALVVGEGSSVEVDSSANVVSPGDHAISVGGDASKTYNLTLKGSVTAKYFPVNISTGVCTVKIDGAKLTATDEYLGSVVKIESGASGADVTVTNSTLTGPQGILAMDGKLTISDSTITGKADQKGDPTPGTTNQGSALSISKTKLTIKSGTFISEKGHALYINADSTGNAISGGTFRSKRANWDAVAGKKSTNMITGGTYYPNKKNVMKDSINTTDCALVGVTDGTFYVAAYDKVMPALYAENAAATKLTVGAATAGKVINGCKAHTQFLNLSGVDVSLLIGTDDKIAANKGTLPKTATTQAWIFHNDLVKLTAAANKEATCTLPAVSADCWYCAELKKAYDDAGGQTENTTVITAAAKGHTWGEWDANGDRVCTVCGEKEHDDSKVQPPAPAYQISGRPAKVSAKAVGGRKLTVSWKKPASSKLKKIKGFYIEVATDKNFTNIVRHRKVGKTKTSYTFKKLKKGTRYYVRVRFYKGSKISKWSAVKYRKVK